MGVAHSQKQPILTARQMGLIGCTRCARVHKDGTTFCEICGTALQSRDPKAMQRVWAWWIAGMMFYIPANIFPMLKTHTLVYDDASTIVGGAIAFLRHGDWFVGSVILIASVVIPVSKFVAIAGLAIGVKYGSFVSPRQRLVLYEVVEYIGRWSMVDVFVVAITAGLVQFQAVATITAGKASLFFALSVIFTMLSAQSFDTRAIWDASAPKEPET